jgi:hypothetical protein
MLPEKGFSDYGEAKRTAQEAGGRPGLRPSSHSRIDEEMRAGVRRFLVIEYLGIGVSGYLRFSPQWTYLNRSIIGPVQLRARDLQHLFDRK